MCNCLITPLIDDMEGMEGGGKCKRAKEDNRGRGWFSTAAMTVNGGVAVVL